MTKRLPSRTSTSHTHDAQGVLLKDRAYTDIKHGILSEVYAPGTFLSERRLADDLKLGKAPIRQAVQRLATEGFVTISPRQGIVVKALSFEEMVEHFEIRIALERHIVRRLAGQLSKEQTRTLQTFLDTQKCLLDKAEPSDEKDPASINVDFHALLCTFLGNKQITKVMEHQHDMLYRVVKRLYQKQPDRKVQSHVEHSELAAALIAGNATKAADLVEAHIEIGKRLLLTP